MDKLHATESPLHRVVPQDLTAKRSTTGEDRRFVAALLCVSLAAHLFMALNLGAKFWFDSVTYFQLAEGLVSPNALRSLYSGPFGIIFQHLTPGLSLLILIFEGLFGGHMWLAFAIFQNAIDVLACVYLATSLSGYFGRASQLAVVILIPLFPYFSAFHNAILTESLTSSLVMIMVGVTIRCLEDRMGCVRGAAIILLLGIFGAQIRSYVIGISGGLSLLVVFCSIYRRRVWLYLTIVASISVGFLAFPLYRASVGAEFFLPNVDALMLMHAHYVNWNLDDRSKRALNGVVLDQEIVRKLETADSELGVADVIEVVDDLVQTGISRAEAIKRVGRAGWVVRTQSWEVVARQLQLSLSSLGFQWLSTCCERTRVLAFNNFTSERMLAHLKYYYLWNAGLDTADYVAMFQTFKDMYRHAPYYELAIIDWYTSRVGPFVLAHPYPWRDFLGLGAVPPDLFILASLAGFLVMGKRDRRVIIIVILMMAVVYAASLSGVVLGDNRYAYFLWPFYLAGDVGLITWMIQFGIQAIRGLKVAYLL